MGRKFLLNIDNMSMKYLFDQLDLNARQARWLAFLSNYHFELKHIKGKQNKFLDALIRQNHRIYKVNLSQANADLHENIRTGNRVDPFYVEILKNVKEYSLFQQKKEYKVNKSELLWSKDCLYVPDGGDLQSNILT